MTLWSEGATSRARGDAPAARRPVCGRRGTEGTAGPLLTVWPPRAPALPLSSAFEQGAQAPLRKVGPVGGSARLLSCRNHPAAAVQDSGPFVKHREDVVAGKAAELRPLWALQLRAHLCPRLTQAWWAGRLATVASPRGPWFPPHPRGLQPAALLSPWLCCVISGATKQTWSGLPPACRSPTPTPWCCVGLPFQDSLRDFPGLFADNAMWGRNPDLSRVLHPLHTSPPASAFGCVAQTNCKQTGPHSDSAGGSLGGLALSWEVRM